jgi:predicted metal-dependent hydrolase
MPETIHLGDLAVQVFARHPKYPPERLSPGDRVVISCPARHSLENIRAYALAKLAWIRKQQRKLQAQPREPRREMLSGRPITSGGEATS